MDQPNMQPKPQFVQPVISGMPTGSFHVPNMMPGGRPIEMGQPNMRPGMNNMMHKPVINMGMPLSEHDQKKRQFAKGVYVSGFEETLTVAMLQDYFNKVKTVHGIKLPLTKFNENKGFAFLYFGSQDDAKQVKQKLDRTVILRKKIRVTRTVLFENLSKMMFKMNYQGKKPEQIQQAQKIFFNQENLEKVVEQTIKQLFNDSIQLNKIIIPASKKQKKQLKYARVFFYISNLKDAYQIARRMDENTGQRNDKNEYDVILNYIMRTLNKHDTFSKYAKAELYEYTKKNQANVLHIKGIRYNDKQDQSSFSKQIEEFIQSKNPQWAIKNCFACIDSKLGAWANVTFGTPQQAYQAFDTLKNQRAKFRDVPIYASLKNVRDNRTVVLSAIKKDVDQKVVHKFLTAAAVSSGMLQMNNPDKGRKYDFFSFNIIQEKTFYKTNNGSTVSSQIDKKLDIDMSWRQINTVPRRIIVHFINDISDEQLRDLTNHLKTTDGFKQIFIDGDKKWPYRANHQRGHIKDDMYVPHIERKTNKPKRPQTMPKPQRNLNPRPNFNNNNERKQNITAPKIDFTSLNVDKGGIPNIQHQGGRIPNMGGNHPRMMPMQGRIPQMGMKPNMDMSQLPQMGGQGIPQMGQGGMGGMIRPPIPGIIPGMGMGSKPPMTGQQPIPQMGGGGIRPMGQKPSEEKKDK